MSPLMVDKQSGPCDCIALHQSYAADANYGTNGTLVTGVKLFLLKSKVDC